MPTPDTAFSMMEFQLLTKQLLVQSRTQNIDFMLPPSTQKIVVFIQDAAQELYPILMHHGLKFVNSRMWPQSLNDMAVIQIHGMDFYKRSKSHFSGITKPQSMFQPLEEVKYNTN